MIKALKILMMVVALSGLVLLWAGDSSKQGNTDKPVPPGEGKRGDGDNLKGALAQNSKVQEEMKRHEGVMKPLAEQVKTLKEKIMTDLKSKMGERKDSGDMPPMGQGAPKPDDKMKEKMEKLLEPYQAEAEQIAGKIAAELVLHHQNLAKILEAEKENITKNITKDILMPMPRQRGNMRDPNDRGIKKDEDQNENPPTPPDEPDENEKEE